MDSQNKITSKFLQAITYKAMADPSAAKPLTVPVACGSLAP